MMEHWFIYLTMLFCRQFQLGLAYTLVKDFDSAILVCVCVCVRVCVCACVRVCVFTCVINYMELCLLF